MAPLKLPQQDWQNMSMPIEAPLALGALYSMLGVIGLQHHPSWTTLAVSAVLCVALLALSVIDLRVQRLPDVITYPLIAAGPPLAHLLGWGDPFWHAGSAAAGYLALFAIATAYAWLRGREGLGMGDAKLFAGAGAWLGAEALPSVLLWSTGSAIAAILIAQMRGRIVLATTRIPFGPFLALGFWIVWLFGPLL